MFSRVLKFRTLIHIEGKFKRLTECITGILAVDVIINLLTGCVTGILAVDRVINNMM